MPFRYSAPTAAVPHRPSANRKVKKMWPTRHLSRAAVRRNTSARYYPADGAYPSHRAIDSYRPNYNDSLRRYPSYYDYGEPAGRGYYGRERYYAVERYDYGQRAGGRPWAAEPWSGQYDGYREQRASNYEHAVQSQVAQQEQYYYEQQQQQQYCLEQEQYYHEQPQPSTAERHQYWSDRGRYSHVQSPPAWEGYPPNYDYAVYPEQQAPQTTTFAIRDYEQGASFPARQPASAYAQQEEQKAVYVPHQGSCQQQPQLHGYDRPAYLTQYETTANTLNANASTFQPRPTTTDGHYAAELIERVHLDKKTRPRPASPARQNVLKRPTPTPQYLKNAQQQPQTVKEPRKLLIVLDLNGTLVHRKARGGSSFAARPKVKEFLQYLLDHHKVMVWSSARPENVTGMCEKLFSKEQQLVAVWGRDTLRLPPSAYNAKVQVYKQLSWVWGDARIQATKPNLPSAWDQSNTVLIDDSVEKAASEPYNLLRLEEFEAKPEQLQTDVLGQVVSYLETLKYEKDVSAFMQSMPFRFNAAEQFDWMV